MIGIYKITNPKGKVYIGQSINIYNRWKDNYFSLRCKNQKKLYFSLNKYGVENHTFEIIEKCSEELLDEKEIYWMDYFSCIEEGLNIRGGGSRGKHSESTKNKISTSLQGHQKSEETKKKISKNHSSCKTILQYDLEGNLIRKWYSYSEAQRMNRGNIKNNILGKTKQAGGFIWLREEDKSLLNERLLKIKNYTSPLKNQPKPKTSTKYEYLLSNKNNIESDYKKLTSSLLADKYNVSIPTMISFLKKENLYQFRKNY